MTKSTKLKGYLIGITGGLCIAPDALLSRLVTLDIYSLVFWRLLMSALGFFIITVILYRKQLTTLFKDWGYPNYVMMVVQPISPTGFVIGIIYTSVVNVLVIFAMTPIITALLSWLIWKKRPTKSTLVCMIFALIGMALVVVDGYLLQQAKMTVDSGFVLPIGEIAALIAVIALSFGFCVVNAHPSTNYLPSQCLGTLMFAFLFAPLNGVWMIDAYNFSLVLTIGILVQATASACLFISSKYITSTESALMLLIETIIGPFLVWLFLHETPTLLALGGGLIILLALIANILLQMRDKPQLNNVPIDYK